MSDTKILLIRHGETAWNAVRRLQGHIDIGLNDEGLRQARSLGRALADEPLDLIVSSDLGRAMQTAQEVAAHHELPLRIDPGLRERCYGAFEGLLYTEIALRYPHDYALWQAREVDAVMPPGARVAESFRQFYERATATIVAWAGRHPGRTIAIVAHGGVLECAYRAATGMTLNSPRDFQVKNASINRLRCSGGELILDSWGETAHLTLDAQDDII